MRNKIGALGCAALFLALVAVPFSARAQERDLPELYRLAKAKDAMLARADARLEAGRADQDAAWAALMPHISANGSVRQMWHRVIDYTPTPTDGEYTGYSYGAGGSLAIFSMPAYYQITAATAGISSAEAGIQASRQDLMVRLLDAYLRYLKAKTDEKQYRDELTRVGKVLEQSQAFLKAGTGDVIAVYEAKSRLDNAAADLVKTEGQVRLVQQNLASLTGVTVDAVKDIVIEKASGPQPVELEWWINTMRQRSPIVLQAQKDLQQAEESVKSTRAGYLPTIQGSGGYSVDKGSTFLPNVETQQWYASVGISIPIYSGGELGARTRRAKAGEAERRAMLDDAQEQAIRRLKEAYLNLQYNQSLVEAYQRKLESAELQLAAVRKGRSIGTRTSIDLLNAEQIYSVSLRDLSAALYDNLQRRLELKAAAGILEERDLTELGSMVAVNK